MNRKKGKTKSHLTRRQTLALMGSCGLTSVFRSPIEVLLSGIVDGIIQKAQASTGTGEPRNYVYLSLSGAPSRWHFDLPLNPYGGPVSPHPQIRTRFGGTGPNAGAPEYKTVAITRGGVTLEMPWLWNCEIPTTSGGSVPMADLLNNMVMIRGINMGVDGHFSNLERQIRPVAHAPSITGAVADATNTPIPAVGIAGSAHYVYKSRKGIGQTYTDFVNPLHQILAPFNNAYDGTAPYLSRRDAIDTAVNRALGSLADYSRSSHPGAGSLFEMRHKAESLIRAGVGDVGAEYTRLFNKYASLISACASSPIPGVSDRPIPYGDPAIMVSDHVTSILAIDKEMTRNPDLRTLIQSSTHVPMMIEGFAIAEYLLTRGYSSSVMWAASFLANINYENKVDVISQQARGNEPTGVHYFDEHSTGAVTSLIVNSFFYRALASCIYEFISVLKSHSLFSETVINIGSEFGRIPRGSMGGSDHGWSSHAVSLFSGAISEPRVLGNVLLDSTQGAQAVPGSWGAAAAVKVDGTQRHLAIGHMTSTIATLLRVETPTPNNSALLLESGSGQLSPTIELGITKGEG